MIDAKSILRVDERCRYLHILGFRPGDGQVCKVSPPRFSWPYLPEIVPTSKMSVMPKTTFTLQIAGSSSFDNPRIEVKDTPYNFYNALPVLPPGEWHWRVGYRQEGKKLKWSATRTFVIPKGAVQWDRTIIDRIGEHLTEHPRILFTKKTWPAIKALRERNPECKQIYEEMLRRANSAMRRPWWKDFPKSDAERVGGNTKFHGSKYYAGIGRGLWAVARAYKFSGDPKYAGVKERFLKLAAWPPGGFSSPEGLGKADAKNSTAITMNLGMYLDWFYHDLTPSERKTILESLRWRIRHNIEGYSWRRRGKVKRNGVAMFPASHPYEDFMWTLPGALAAYEHLPVAKQAVEVGLHYLAGVTSGMGPDEAWNEGMSYGNWKCHTMITTATLFQCTVPELHLDLSPYFARVGEFFRWLSPLGIECCSFGNYGNSTNYVRTHHGYFRKLAYLTGDGRVLRNWEACHKKGKGARAYSEPSIEYVLPFHFQRPKPALETKRAALFPVEGWAFASTQPPSDASAYKNAVGMLFHCRPRGGYSHSFFSENAFDIFAYGAVIATGGAGTQNSNPLSRDSMSHNTILINGVGQSQNKYSRKHPWAGRIVAWHETPDYIYWVGDATGAYQKHSGLDRAIRHVLFVRGKYFVIFDDLGMTKGAKPVRFSWLYHVRQDVPLEIKEQGDIIELRYAVRNTEVRVVQASGVAELKAANLRGVEAYRNPITGKNWFEAVGKGISRSGRRITVKGGVKAQGETMNNVWITSKATKTSRTFLAVVMPWKKGMPEPRFERLSDHRVKVAYGDRSDVIGFGAGGSADIRVDFEGIRESVKRKGEGND